MNKRVRDKLPGEAYSANVRARFWLTSEQGYLGIGRVTLLQKIDELGSISAAAKSMKMSYKKAWTLVDEMNQMYQEPLVIKEQGGKQGGGTRLTLKGHQAVAAFLSLEQKMIAFLQQEAEQLNL